MKSLDSNLDNLVKWINSDSSRSFVSPKIKVKDAQPSGRGIYAQKGIMRSEELIRIPTSFLLNFTTVVAHITKNNPEIHLHEPMYQQVLVPPPAKDDIGDFYGGLSLDSLLSLLSFQLLSMFLVLEKQRDSYWTPFIEMLPEIGELDLAPIVWKILDVPNADLLFRMLPRSARKHTEQVIGRFEKDFSVVLDIMEASRLTRRDFLWAWMCINSRCLYMNIPQGKDSSDNFTMAPYVDFLNHLNDDQCGIKIDNTGFHVVTSSAYSPGDELYFSYGPHSNEFLLCEYGFALPQNKWNYVDVSDFILPLLRPKQVDYLKSCDYYGEYTVNELGMSFRTEIALATLQESEPLESRKLKALVGGLADGSLYEKKSQTLLTKILEKLLHDADRKVESSDEDTQRRMRAIEGLYRDTRRIAEAVIKSYED